MECFLWAACWGCVSIITTTLSPRRGSGDKNYLVCLDLSKGCVVPKPIISLSLSRELREERERVKYFGRKEEYRHGRRRFASFFLLCDVEYRMLLRSTKIGTWIRDSAANRVALWAAQRKTLLFKDGASLFIAQKIVLRRFCAEARAQAHAKYVLLQRLCAFHFLRRNSYSTVPFISAQSLGCPHPADQ